VALFWIGIWFVTSAVAGILGLVNIEQRKHEDRPPVVAGETIDEQVENQMAAERDWRPLVSYTENLSRIGQQLLGSDAAWEKLSRLQPEGRGERFLLRFRGPQFPWVWSAIVLALWLGLSLCILNIRIKSLDRLR